MNQLDSNKTSKKDIIIASAIALGCISLVGYAFISPKKSTAEGNEASSTKIKEDNYQFFTYSSGLTGIYDPSTKIIYVYDSNFKKCFIKRKIDKLGMDLIDLNIEK
jgi:hypothetical protein